MQTAALGSLSCGLALWCHLQSIWFKGIREKTNELCSSWFEKRHDLFFSSLLLFTSVSSPWFLASFPPPTTCVWASVAVRCPRRGALLPELWRFSSGPRTSATEVGRGASYAFEAARSSSVRDTCRTWTVSHWGKDKVLRMQAFLNVTFLRFPPAPPPEMNCKGSNPLQNYLIQNNSHSNIHIVT